MPELGAGMAAQAEHLDRVSADFLLGDEGLADGDVHGGLPAQSLPGYKRAAELACIRNQTPPLLPGGGASTNRSRQDQCRSSNYADSRIPSSTSNRRFTCGTAKSRHALWNPPILPK